MLLRRAAPNGRSPWVPRATRIGAVAQAAVRPQLLEALEQILEHGMAQWRLEVHVFLATDPLADLSAALELQQHLLASSTTEALCGSSQVTPAASGSNGSTSRRSSRAPRPPERIAYRRAKRCGTRDFDVPAPVRQMRVAESMGSAFDDG